MWPTAQNFLMFINGTHKGSQYHMWDMEHNHNEIGHFITHLSAHLSWIIDL